MGDLAGVSWTTDTGAGALGRHGSDALHCSEDEALGCGEEQQNREPDRGRNVAFLVGALCCLRLRHGLVAGLRHGLRPRHGMGWSGRNGG